MAIKVIQWATGTVGTAALKYFIENPVTELVGLYVTNPDKAGKDAGTLVGLPDTGVIATSDIDALVALEADADTRRLPDPGRTIEKIELSVVHDRLADGDRLAGEWRSFDRLAKGQPIAWRADGTAITAPEDGYVVFPNPNATVGREWFYFARQGDRPFCRP